MGGGVFGRRGRREAEPLGKGEGQQMSFSSAGGRYETLERAQGIVLI